MSPAKLSLTILQGATFAKQIIWQTGNPPAPVDLTGFTARMQIRQTIDSETILIDLTTENDGIVLGGVLGTIDIAISALDTADLSFDTGYYDIELVSGETVTRLAQGHVKLSKEVTRV